MNISGKKLRVGDGGRVRFLCPGCDEFHSITVGEGAAPRWGFNGNGDAPTFTPSILVTGVQFLTEEQEARVAAGETIEPDPLRCHSFVTDGKIRFLADCTHALAGQTVDLPDYPA